MYVNHQFPARMRQLRMERGLLQRDLEEALRLRAGSVSQYERRLREPGFDMLMTVADHFDVSLDYLMGRPNASKESPALAAGRQRMAGLVQRHAEAFAALDRPQRLALLLSLAAEAAPEHFTLERLARHAGSPSAALRLAREEGVPLPDVVMRKLSEYLGLSPEWLMGQEGA